MAVILVRVDDRLIHGQVVGGWLPVIQAERIVVASDRAASDPLQAGLMRMAVPDDVAVDVVGVEEALGLVKGGAWGSQRVMLLVPGITELARLVEGGASLTQVNIGGMHDGPGRSMVASHLSFSSEERTLLSKLFKRGVRFETRPLPGDPPVPLEDVFPL